MPRVQFDVPVTSEEDEVRRRLNEAGDSPGEFVRLFTSDPRVTAAIVREGIGWNLTVQGPQFLAEGWAELHHRDPGSLIVVTLNVTGRGILAFAGPMMTMAVGKIEAEAKRMLQSEFGRP